MCFFCVLQIPRAGLSVTWCSAHVQKEQLLFSAAFHGPRYSLRLVVDAVLVTSFFSYFLHKVKGRHVLIRTDNTTVMAYINQQGGLWSPSLHRVARDLLLWAHENLLSLRAVNLPGMTNWAVHLLSRGIPSCSEWRLHPEVVSLI